MIVSREAGGIANLCISIADWPVRLSIAGYQPAALARLREHYAAFLIPGRRTPLTVRVEVEPGPPFIPFEPGAWQIRSALREGRLQFASHYEEGWVDWTTGQGSLLMRPPGDPENFLRVVYAWRCLEEGALLLHGCGVIHRGTGYVFFGPSGSGKTTVASLSTGDTILSDDIVVIKRRNGRFHVYGVPFRGDLPEALRTNAVAVLGGLFTLVKDGEHSVKGLPGPQAVARLAACAPFVMAQPGSAQRVMETCAALAAAVPVRALHFRKDNGFWRDIDGLS